MGMIASVGLVLHPRRDCSQALDMITTWARNRDAAVLGLPDEVSRLPEASSVVDEPDLAERSDLLVSLGGDGTMLRAMRLMHGHAAPVLGVNLGKLGFLAEIDIPDLGDAL